MTMATTTKTQGQIAFEAYYAGLIEAEDMPWGEISDDRRARWEAAARAAEGAAPSAGGGTFREWAVLELMGHRRFAGLVSDVELFGSRMVRIDIPSTPPATQFYGPGSIYCVTPTDEATCRAFAARAAAPAPIQRWELTAGRDVVEQDIEHDGGADVDW